MTMTVRKLIEHLQTFDPDLQVVAYAAFENYDYLCAEGITLEDGEYYTGRRADTLKVGPHVEIIGGCDG